MVGLAGLADGGVEFGPLLGFVLGFEEVADGAEAVGVAVADLAAQAVTASSPSGWQPKGLPESDSGTDPLSAPHPGATDAAAPLPE